MKKLLIIIAVLAFQKVFSQNNPIKWEFSSVQVDSNIYEIHLKAVIPPDIIIFSQDSIGDILSLRTKINFVSSPNYELVDEVEELGDKLCLRGKIYVGCCYYRNEVTFLQVIKVRNSHVPVFSLGVVSYRLSSASKMWDRISTTFCIPIANSIIVKH